MNTHPPHRYVWTTLTVLACAALLAAACSSGSTGTAQTVGTATTSPASIATASPADIAGSTASSRNRDSERETAESRLEIIGSRLSTVLADYKSGKTQQAYTLAKSISVNLYEGPTEGICSKTAPSVERQIDPLLAATLPAAIQGKMSASQIAALTTRAQTLASGCLNAIHRSE